MSSKSITVHTASESENITYNDGENLLQTLHNGGFSQLPSPCGGKGRCGKCLILVKEGDFLGNLLACKTLSQNGMEVWVPEETESRIIESGTAAHFDYNPSVQLLENGESYGLAVDIGTTTIVVHLHDLTSGMRIATISEANRQKVYGADLISRIQACSEGKLEHLAALIQSQIKELACRICTTTGIETKKIIYMTIAGNTVMEHLFCNISPVSIGQAPFTPESYFGEAVRNSGFTAIFGFHHDCTIYLSPAVSGYVGGDITAGLLSTKIWQEDELSLFLDIGTNGEMALGNRGAILCCATAAGPAFEGAHIEKGMHGTVGAISALSIHHNIIKCEVIGGVKPVGICGSGLIDAIALFIEYNLIDETGRINPPDEVDRNFAGYIGTINEKKCIYLTDDHSIYITQDDIRQIQLAKAAVHAGILCLVEEKGITMDEINHLYIAGGFGSYINKKSAAAIGLFPFELLPKCVEVGNAAGEGASSIMLSRKAMSTLNKIAANCSYIELSTHAPFMEYYVDAMTFGEDE